MLQAPCPSRCKAGIPHNRKTRWSHCEICHRSSKALPPPTSMGPDRSSLRDKVSRTSSTQRTFRPYKTMVRPTKGGIQSIRLRWWDPRAANRVYDGLAHPSCEDEEGYERASIACPPLWFCAGICAVLVVHAHPHVCWEAKGSDA